MTRRNITTGKNAEAVNFNLIFQWHFAGGRGWTAFLDGGAGIMYSNHSVPDDGSHFNFTPQAGFGFTFDISDQMRFLAGARWQHISNANTSNNNPGRDSILSYVGVSVPF